MAAAAIHVEADGILTDNVKDFKSKQLRDTNVSIYTPAGFVTRLIETSPSVVFESTRYSVRHAFTPCGGHLLHQQHFPTPCVRPWFESCSRSCTTRTSMNQQSCCTSATKRPTAIDTHQIRPSHRWHHHHRDHLPRRHPPATPQSKLNTAITNHTGLIGMKPMFQSPMTFSPFTSTI